ncbi:MAG: phosphodiesterase [Albidovulum sp.]
MQKLLVFTDIHFLADGGTIIGLDPVARFQMGLAQALANHPDARRIIITGDLTHHGEAAEFARLRAVLADCPMPVSLMIGNHDRRAPFRAAFPEVPVTDAGFVQSTIDTGSYRLIMLDTLDEEAEVEHSGLLCPHRLDWMDRAIAEAGDRRVIIFTHHPPITTGFAGMDRIGLRNRAEVAQRLRNHGNVCQIIAGHVHRTISGATAGIPTAIFKSPCHQMPMALENDDEHLSIDEPGAYGLLLLGDDGVIVHTEDFTLPAGEVASYHP